MLISSEGSSVSSVVDIINHPSCQFRTEGVENSQCSILLSGEALIDAWSTSDTDALSNKIKSFWYKYKCVECCQISDAHLMCRHFEMSSSDTGHFSHKINSNTVDKNVLSVLLNKNI